MIVIHKKKIISCLLIALLIIPLFSFSAISTESNNTSQEPDTTIDFSSIPSCGAYLLPPSELPDERPTNLAPAPKYWNWQDATYNGITGDWLTSVKKQGDCGSCWAFAALGALEAMVNIQRGDPTIDTDLSEQQLVSCCTRYSNGCHGGNSYKSWEYLMDNGGAILESCFPYQGVDYNGCHSWKTNDCNREPVLCQDQCDNSDDFTVPIKRIGGYHDSDFDLIKYQVYNHGPVVTFMLIYEDFNYYKGGIYRYDHNSELLGGHAVVIVGYDDNEDYLICKNSWGKTWGENGFFRIPHGEVMLGEQIYFVEVDTDKLNYPPQADAGDYYAADPSETISFSSENSYDQDGNIISYNWDFGDGTTSTEKNPTHSYAQKGIYPVVLTVEDALGKVDTDETAAYINLWDIGDTWTYTLRFETIDDALYPPIRLPISLKISDFTLTVTDETNDLYTVDVTGSVKGNLSFLFDRENAILDFQVWGKINRGSITGTFDISKKGLGIKGYDIDVSGFSQFLGLPIIPIPLYIPLPFRISMDQSFEIPKAMMGIYPEVGNSWENPETESSVQMLFSSMFGLISKSFDNDQVINEPSTINVEDFTSISTSLGSYPCYLLSSDTSTQTNHYYYSTQLHNIVKIDIQDPELFSLTGELVTTTYS